MRKDMNTKFGKQQFGRKVINFFFMHIYFLVFKFDCGVLVVAIWIFNAVSGPQLPEVCGILGPLDQDQTIPCIRQILNH